MQHFVRVRYRVSEFSKCPKSQTHISNFVLRPKDPNVSKLSIYSGLVLKIPHAINRALLIFSDRNLAFTTAKKKIPLLEMPPSLIYAENLAQIIFMSHLAFT